MSRSHFLLTVVTLVGLSLLTSRRNALWADPIKLWSDTAEKSPDKPRPWINLARAERLAGNDEIALSVFRHVRRLFPDNVGVNTYARVEIAGIRMHRGELDWARNELEHILVDVSSGKLPVADALAAYNNLAFIYAVQGRGSDAIALLDTLISYDDYWAFNASAAYNRGMAYAAMHRCDEASAAFRYAHILDESVPAGACA